MVTTAVTTAVTTVATLCRGALYRIEEAKIRQVWFGLGLVRCGFALGRVWFGLGLVGLGWLCVGFGLVWVCLRWSLVPFGFALGRIRFGLGSLGFGFVLVWVRFV